MTAEQPPLHIFCGYAHKDQHLFQQLYTALAVLRRQEAMSIWHDGELLPGAPWELEIERELNMADIILLLISPAFMDSDYCYRKEMQWAIARHTSGDTCVIPIIGKPTVGWKDTPLGKLQALPTRAEPITSWSNADEAFANVAEGIQKAIHQVNERYRVQEYSITLPITVYGELHEEWGEYVAAELPPGAAKQRTLQWVKAVSQEGTLQEKIVSLPESELLFADDDPEERTWLLTDHQYTCYMSLERHHPVGSSGSKDYLTYERFFQSTCMNLTSQHLPLLDRLIKIGQLPYRAIGWMLTHDINVDAHVERIQEQTGQTPTSSQRYPEYDPEFYPFSSTDGPIVFATYTFKKFDRSFYGRDNPTIEVTLSAAARPSYPAGVGLIYVAPEPEDVQDELPTPTGFYHAHTVFSVQKIMHLLYGKIPHKEMWQLIEKACTP